MPVKAPARRPLVNSEVVCEYLGITTDQLHKMRHIGKAPKAVKVGNRLKFRWEDVDAWLERNAS